MAESVLSRFLSRLSGSRREQALARYVVAEARRGRRLSKILDDPYVQNRADDTTLMRLMDHPEVVDAVGSDAVVRLRAALTSRS